MLCQSRVKSQASKQTVGFKVKRPRVEPRSDSTGKTVCRLLVHNVSVACILVIVGLGHSAAQEFSIGQAQNLRAATFAQQQRHSGESLAAPYHQQHFHRGPHSADAQRRSSNDYEDSLASLANPSESAEQQQQQDSEARQLQQLHQVVDTVARLLSEEEEQQRQQQQQAPTSQHDVALRQQQPQQPRAAALQAPQPASSALREFEANNEHGSEAAPPLAEMPTAEQMSESAIRRAIEELERVQQQERARQQSGNAPADNRLPLHAKGSSANSGAQPSSGSSIESLIDELGDELIEDQLASASQETERLVRPGSGESPASSEVTRHEKASDASVVSVAAPAQFGELPGASLTGEASKDAATKAQQQRPGANKQLVMGRLDSSLDSELNSALTNEFYSFHAEGNSAQIGAQAAPISPSPPTQQSQSQQQRAAGSSGSETSTINVVASDTAAALSQLEPQAQKSTPGGDLEPAAQTEQRSPSAAFGQSQASSIRFDFSQPAPGPSVDDPFGPVSSTFPPPPPPSQLVNGPSPSQQFREAVNFWRPTSGGLGGPISNDFALQFKAPRQTNDLPTLPPARFQQLASPAPFLHHQPQQQAGGAPAASRNQPHIHFTGHSFVASDSFQAAPPRQQQQQQQQQAPTQQPIISIISGSDTGALGNNAVSWNPPALPPTQPGGLSFGGAPSTRAPPISSTIGEKLFTSSPAPVHNAELGPQLFSAQFPSNEQSFSSSGRGEQFVSSTASSLPDEDASSDQFGGSPPPGASTPASSTARTGPWGQTDSQSRPFGQPNGRSPVSQFEPISTSTLASTTTKAFGMPATSARQNREQQQRGNSFAPASELFASSSPPSVNRFTSGPTGSAGFQGPGLATAAPPPATTTSGPVNTTAKKDDTIIYYYYYYDDNKNATVVAKNLSATDGAGGLPAGVPLETAIEADGGVEDTPYMDDPVPSTVSEPPVPTTTRASSPQRAGSTTPASVSSSTSTSSSTALRPSFGPSSPRQAPSRPFDLPPTSTASTSSTSSTTTRLPPFRISLAGASPAPAGDNEDEDRTGGLEHSNAPSDSHGSRNEVGPNEDQIQNDQQPSFAPPSRTQPVNLPSSSPQNQSPFRNSISTTQRSTGINLEQPARIQHQGDSLRLNSFASNATSRGSAPPPAGQRAPQPGAGQQSSSAARPAAALLSNASRYGTSHNSLIGDPTYGLDPSGPLAAGRQEIAAGGRHNHNHNNQHHQHHQQQPSSGAPSRATPLQQPSAGGRGTWQQDAPPRAQPSAGPVRPTDEILDARLAKEAAGSLERPKQIGPRPVAPAQSNSGQFSSQRQQASPPSKPQPVASAPPPKQQQTRQFYPESSGPPAASAQVPPVIGGPQLGERPLTHGGPGRVSATPSAPRQPTAIRTDLAAPTGSSPAVDSDSSPVEGGQEENEGPSAPRLGNGRPASSEGTTANGFTRAPPTLAPAPPSIQTGQRLSSAALASTSSQGQPAATLPSSIATTRLSSSIQQHNRQASITSAMPAPETASPKTLPAVSTTAAPSTTTAASTGPSATSSSTSSSTTTTSTSTSTFTPSTASAPAQQTDTSGTTESSADSPASTRRKFGNRNNRFQTRLTASRLGATSQSSSTSSSGATQATSSTTTSTTTRRPFSSTTRKSSKQLFPGRRRLGGGGASSTQAPQAGDQPMASGPTTESAPIQVSSSTASSISASRARFGSGFTARSRSSTTSAPVTSADGGAKPPPSLFGAQRATFKPRLPFMKAQSSTTTSTAATPAVAAETNSEPVSTSDEQTPASSSAATGGISETLSMSVSTSTSTSAGSSSGGETLATASLSPNASSDQAGDTQAPSASAEGSSSALESPPAGTAASTAATPTTSAASEQRATSKPRRPLFTSRQRSSALFGNRRNSDSSNSTATVAR